MNMTETYTINLKAISEQHAIHQKLLQLIITDLLPERNQVRTGQVVANIMMNIVQPMLDEEGTSWNDLDEIHYDYKDLMYSCAKAQAAGVLESRHVKQILENCFKLPYVGYDVVQYCRESGILEETSGNELLELVKQVMMDNPKAVEELRGGKDKAIGALVGAVMKKQKSSPTEIQKLIRELL